MVIRTGKTAARSQAGRPAPRASRAIHYPESDGKPTGETEIHVLALLRLFQILRGWFSRRDDVYVDADLMLYWDEGNPRSSVAPDVFVAVGAGRLPPRRVFKMWEDGTPTAIFEITSKTSRRADTVTNRALYERQRVREYLLFDPLGEYPRPPLHGFRLGAQGYEAIAADSDGSLASTVLGLRYRAGGPLLRVYAEGTGEELMSPEERALALECEVCELWALLDERSSGSKQAR
jgi:Uma2 family endonuclease